jgi:hypothetical protein
MITSDNRCNDQLNPPAETAHDHESRAISGVSVKGREAGATDRSAQWVI